MEKKENINVSYRDPETNKVIYILDEEHLQQELDKAREERYGFDVRLVFTEESLYEQKEEVLKNITEIHYCYRGRKKIAFESDIDKTGCTYLLSDIKEFEALSKLKDNK
jgi:hypothetical protein